MVDLVTVKLSSSLIVMQNLVTVRYHMDIGRMVPKMLTGTGPCPLGIWYDWPPEKCPSHMLTMPNLLALRRNVSHLASSEMIYEDMLSTHYVSIYVHFVIWQRLLVLGNSVLPCIWQSTVESFEDSAAAVVSMKNRLICQAVMAIYFQMYCGCVIQETYWITLWQCWLQAWQMIHLIQVLTTVKMRVLVTWVSLTHCRCWSLVHALSLSTTRVLHWRNTLRRWMKDFSVGLFILFHLLLCCILCQCLMYSPYIDDLILITCRSTVLLTVDVWCVF